MKWLFLFLCTFILQKIQIMKSKLLISIFIAFLFHSNISSQTARNTASGRQNLIQEIKKFEENPMLEKSSWSIQVRNTKSGEIIAESNAKKNLVPASVMKAVTTGVAFIRLGANYRFKTEFYYDGKINSDSTLRGNLIIKGYGDPTLGSHRWQSTHIDTIFNNIYSEIKKAGINKINGNIIVDISSFDVHQVSPSWQWGDIGNHFGAGAGALNFNENIFQIFFKPGNQIGLPSSIDSLYPQLNHVQIVNNVKTGARKSGDNVNIYADHFYGNCQMEGTIPIDTDRFMVRGAIPQPEMVFADYLSTFLKAKGLKTTGKIERIRYTSEIDTNNIRTLFYTHYSPSLQSIATITNKFSHNTFAEAIFKTIGLNRFSMASFDTGSTTILNYLKQQKIDIEGVQIRDGSGLSRNNLVSADFLCSFFNFMSTQKNFNSYYETLAEAGESGTLRRLFQNQKTKINIRAKSGTMNGVRAYGGYITNQKNELLSFAIIINHFSVKSTDIRDIMEQLMLAIAQSE